MIEPRISYALSSAIQTLLETPLLLEGMDGFREVWNWRIEAVRWFKETTAWQVQTGPGVMRLVATGELFDAGRALDGLKTARASSMLAWVLWYHEFLGLRLGEPKQFTLSELAKQIESSSKLSFSDIQNRRALVQAVRTLEELGGMRVLDEQTQAWEGEPSSGGALLEFTAGAAYLISSPPELPASDQQRAARALLIGPVFNRVDDPQAFSTLETSNLADALEATLGWQLEVNVQFASLLRTGNTRGLAKRWTPGRSVTEAAALLVLEAIRTELQTQPQSERLELSRSSLQPDEHGQIRLTQNRFYELLDLVRNQYRNFWGEQGKQLGTARMQTQILELWRSWDLARLEGEFITLKPGLARFTASYEDRILERPRKARGTKARTSKVRTTK
jgi:hypothetical protein